MTSATRRYSRT
ncbi:unnamed protein product [Linum tenue]|uniref:Uncharacterized protein n=1 Tax=Linum tenue TaxID=586396 RepID=A0AAV0LRP8_9ROSI|nr:unnamed protein product [Linum tenue]CAI0437229.1 unnamed protein product [Linum tenue]